MRVTMLGTGTSTGIPVIGCSCRVCTSDDPRDNRTRTACWVQVDGIDLVIDTGPDFRRQALREGISKVDAVLYTHHHFDHIVGIDDLRPFLFRNRSAIPCYAHSETAHVMHSMFGYIFADGSYPGVPNLELITVESSFEVVSRYDGDSVIEVHPIQAYHGSLPLFGYRIGNFAYLTDTSHIPEESLQQLKGVHTLVLDALRHEAHPTHFTISEATEMAKRIGAERTFFTHMTHSLLHEEESSRLPDGVDLAYDGLVFDVP
jgi:phosphoribosyl 1,2-cyclic phosphate phosphodiesterase